jgi:beta-lactamase superfamily II metal-dependent hydrolase
MTPRPARTIVVDTGKNFQAAAVEWFPEYHLRRIDAVLLTHAHADGAPNYSSRLDRLIDAYSNFERA